MGWPRLQALLRLLLLALLAWQACHGRPEGAQVRGAGAASRVRQMRAAPRAPLVPAPAGQNWPAARQEGRERATRPPAAPQAATNRAAAPSVAGGGIEAAAAAVEPPQLWPARRLAASSSGSGSSSSRGSAASGSSNGGSSGAGGSSTSSGGSSTSSGSGSSTSTGSSSGSSSGSGGSSSSSGGSSKGGSKGRCTPTIYSVAKRRPELRQALQLAAAGYNWFVVDGASANKQVTVLAPTNSALQALVAGAPPALRALQLPARRACVPSAAVLAADTCANVPLVCLLVALPRGLCPCSAPEVGRSRRWLAPTAPPLQMCARAGTRRK